MTIASLFRRNAVGGRKSASADTQPVEDCHLEIACCSDPFADELDRIFAELHALRQSLN